jgi:hypothetical protein
VQSGIRDDEFERFAMHQMEVAAAAERGSAKPNEAFENPALDSAKFDAVRNFFAAVHQLILDWDAQHGSPSDFSVDFRAELSADGARKDFDKLREAGCHSWVLAGILIILRDHKALESEWNETIGLKGKAAIRTIDAAANIIDAPTSSGYTSNFSEAGIARRLASDLRLYRLTVEMPTLVAQDAGVRSFKKLIRLVLANYVAKTTGSKHHGAVAGIITEVCTEDGDYNEDAQRRFWHDNRELLEDQTSTLAQMSDFLRDFTTALTALKIAG